MFKKLLLAMVIASASMVRADQIGIQAGGSFDSFSFSSLGNNSSMGGGSFLLSGFYEWNMGNFLNLQPEVIYRGAGDAGDWLSVPLLLKVKFDVLPTLKPFVFAGPEVFFRLSNSSFKTTNFAADIGAGVEFSIAPLISIILSGRYVLGLININNNPTVLGEVKSRNIYIFGGVGIGF